MPSLFFLGAVNVVRRDDPGNRGLAHGPNLIFGKAEGIHQIGESVVIAVEEFELPKNLQDHLRKAISNVNNKSSELLNHKDIEEYYKKIDKQLNEFKEFDKKALKIDNFIHMFDSIDQNLLKWVEDYTKIARKFNAKQCYEGLSIFNKNNNLVLFNIQEELLMEVDDIKKHLTKKSKELGNILYLNKEDIKK
ncbi:7443_t:CDS:2, partial [Racocetra persica]